MGSCIPAPVPQSDLACLEHSAFAGLYHIYHPSAWTTDSACPPSDTHTHFPLTSYNDIKQLQPLALFWVALCDSLQWVMPTMLSWWKFLFFLRREILTLMLDKYFQRKITHLSKLWMPSAHRFSKKQLFWFHSQLFLIIFPLKKKTTLAFDCNN